eukprot:3783514-Prymnesium_polylepis.1
MTVAAVAEGWQEPHWRRSHRTTQALSLGDASPSRDERCHAAWLHGSRRPCGTAAEVTRTPRSDLGIAVSGRPEACLLTGVGHDTSSVGPEHWGAL